MALEIPTSTGRLRANDGRCFQGMMTGRETESRLPANGCHGTFDSCHADYATPGHTRDTEKKPGAAWQIHDLTCDRMQPDLGRCVLYVISR